MSFEHKGLGFRPGPTDKRDKPLMGALQRFGVQKTSGAQFWTNSLRLDQGSEGACVGFGWTQSVNSAPKTHTFSNTVASALYHRAQELDEWDGEDYEGTSVRAGAKASTEKKWIKSYAFTQSIKEVALWVLNRRPVVIGIDWHESDYNPKKSNDYYLTGEGDVVGGHCLVIDGVRWGIGEDYFRLLNSWGNSWAYNGRAKITPSNLERLLSDENSVACTAVEV